MHEFTPLDMVLSRALFPVLAAAVLLLMLMMGVFKPSFLAAGPSRRLRMQTPVWWGGVVLWALFLIAGPMPAAAAFVGLCAVVPGAWRRLGVFHPGMARSALMGLWLAVPVALVAFGANVLGSNIGLVLGDPAGEVGHSLLSDLQANPTPAMIFKVFALAVVAAPLIEEAGYRGFAQTLLMDRILRRYRWGVIAAVSAVFAVAHLPVVTWHALPGLWVLGVGFGAVYERTGSLWAPLVMHAVFNAVNITIVLLGVV